MKFFAVKIVRPWDLKKILILRITKCAWNNNENIYKTNSHLFYYQKIDEIKYVIQYRYTLLLVGCKLKPH